MSAVQAYIMQYTYIQQILPSQSTQMEEYFTQLKSISWYFSSHTLYDVEGDQHMRMKFYVEGPHNKGTVQLDVRKVRLHAR